MVSNTNRTTVLLMSRLTTPPEPKLLTNIGEEAKKRAATFLSQGRICDFLWSRVLLNRLIDQLNLSVDIVERPPQSPRLISKEGDYFCSISHTSTFVGVALSTVNVGIDLEVLDPTRPYEAISERMFGDIMKETPPNDRVLTFYQNWGIHEAATKMRAKVLVEQNSVYAINDLGIKTEACFHTLEKDTLLTVMTDGKTQIRIMTLTPNAL